MEMKKIKNTSRQLHFLIVSKSEAATQISIAAKETIIIPESWITCQIRNLANMNFLTITNPEK
jgi:hypothetical protein